MYVIIILFQKHRDQFYLNYFFMPIYNVLSKKNVSWSKLKDFFSFQQHSGYGNIFSPLCVLFVHKSICTTNR